MIYRIRVEGGLGPEWSERVGGMAVEVHGGHGARTTSDLVGFVADEAQLMGILDQLYTCGARLLGVQRVDEDDATSVADTSGGEKRRDE